AWADSRGRSAQYLARAGDDKIQRHADRGTGSEGHVARGSGGLRPGNGPGRLAALGSGAELPRQGETEGDRHNSAHDVEGYVAGGRAPTAGLNCVKRLHAEGGEGCESAEETGSEDGARASRQAGIAERGLGQQAQAETA